VRRGKISGVESVWYLGCTDTCGRPKGGQVAERDERELSELSEEEEQGDVEGHMIHVGRDLDEDEDDVEAHQFNLGRPNVERPNVERPNVE
jgi:hypothetical protein